ncbi:MAG: antitoxin VapB family protein [Candidatus Woesearchaeota archaeon]|nr:antitoxin VapB family protein [Candidatus Woesearchaeota archaeon]
MSRLINVADDVYNTLVALKDKESFSGVIRKLIVNKSNKEKVLSFFGKKGIDVSKVNSLSQEWKQWSDKYV